MAVFRAEQQAYSRASVYSDNDQTRSECNGVVKFLDLLIEGQVEANYKGEAEILLGDRPSNPGDLDPAGDPFMRSDTAE
jgi:hypothetical protein